MINTLILRKFSIKDFFSKYDQIRRKLRVWSHLLKKSLMEDFLRISVFITFISIICSVHIVSLERVHCHCNNWRQTIIGHEVRSLLMSQTNTIKKISQTPYSIHVQYSPYSITNLIAVTCRFAGQSRI